MSRFEWSPEAIKAAESHVPHVWPRDVRAALYAAAEAQPVVGRFAPFTDDELVELWLSLTRDGESLSPSLVAEVRAEALRRGLVAQDELLWSL
jgi:hypothetical protein